MLTRLEIADLATIAALNIEFQTGMTVLTGESGAGKSIIIDALQLLQGKRADTGLKRTPDATLKVTGFFNCAELPAAITWLQENEIPFALDDEIIVERVITKENRTRATINNQAVTLQTLQEFTQHLFDIHGQHDHYQLLSPQAYREELDQFGKLNPDVNAVHELYNQWKQHHDELAQLEQHQAQEAELQLLQYHYQELSALKLTGEKLADLTKEHQRLAKSDTTDALYQQVLALLGSEQASPLQMVSKIISLLRQSKTPQFDNVLSILSQAEILLDEANNELQNLESALKGDPEKLAQLEQFFSNLNQVARKHRCQIEALPELTQTIKTKIVTLGRHEEIKKELLQKITAAEAAYQTKARQLTKQRIKTAEAFTELLTQQLKQLALTHTEFKVAFQTYEDNLPHPYGNEQISFLVSLNPGLPLQPIHKVASGGELSRLSLAMAVITAHQNPPKALVFDEVDTGISGKTITTVAELLKKVSNTQQVFIITHHAKVASLATEHFKISKKVVAKQTHTEVALLTSKSRIEEIASLLGGSAKDEVSLLHAKQLLENA